MTTLVFRDPYGISTSFLVFEAPDGTGGSLFSIAVPTIVQDPALAVTVAPVTAPHLITVSKTQQPALTVASDPHLTFTMTQTPVMDIYAATTLIGVGEFTQDPALTYIKRDANTYSIAQAPVVGITVTFQSGASNSTFFQTATFAQSPVVTIQRGSQTYFSFAQAPRLSAGIIVDISGVFLVPLDFALTQRPVLNASFVANFQMGAHYTGGWTQLVTPPPSPTKADSRAKMREKEKEERKRLAIIAAEKLKAEQDKRDAEVARIHAVVTQMDMLDASFRPQYEHQIQQLQQALMASELEIAKLRQQVSNNARTQ